MTDDPIKAALPRCGDHVFHRPSGEEWIVAWAEGDDLAWAGWPYGIARVADCEIIRRCDDEEHAHWAQQFSRAIDDPRAARVKHLYAAAVARARENTDG